MLLVHARPEITTGALLEHFAEREEVAALQKLASRSGARRRSRPGAES